MSPAFDAHCHPADVPASGAARLLCCGSRPGDWPEVLALAGADRRVTPCFGLHPWFAGEAPPGWETELERLLLAVPSCAGEIGLDESRPSPRQEEAFRLQLALAARLKRPAVVHCVGGWGRLTGLLRGAGLPAFVVHAYGGSPETAAELAAAGGYFSFGWAVAEQGRKRVRAALAAVPRDRLLFESEGAGRGGLGCVVAAAASLLGEKAETLAALAAANGAKFLSAAPCFQGPAD